MLTEIPANVKRLDKISKKLNLKDFYKDFDLANSSLDEKLWAIEILMTVVDLEVELEYLQYFTSVEDFSFLSCSFMDFDRMAWLSTKGTIEAYRNAIYSLQVFKERKEKEKENEH